MAEKVGGRLRSGAHMAKTVAVEVKYNDFTKVSRQMTLDLPTDSGTEIYRVSKVLFGELWNQKPVRLLGIRTANLVDEEEPEQMSIMDMLNQSTDNRNAKKSREKMKQLDKALDAIKNKYGEDAVSRASLLNGKKEWRNGHER